MADIPSLIEESGAIKWGKFKLSNGSLTDFYIDKYAFETDPAVLQPIAAEIGRRLDPETVDAVAGPELGAVPLVTAVSLETGIRGVFIRKGEKHHGTQSRVEGTIQKGQRIAIVEDVTTTGGTILETADIITELGGQVERLLVVVDRNEGAVENVRDAGFTLEYLVQVDSDLELDGPAARE